MDERPNYFGIIPAEVRYDNDLSASEKIFYAEITALANKTGECWACNKYFINLFDVDIRTISRWLKKLKNKGYIKVNVIYKPNSKEVEKRVIKISNIPMCKNVYTPMDKCSQMSIPPMDKNVQENNTSILIKENIKRNVTKDPHIDLNKEYFQNEEVNNIFLEFLSLRKKLKAVNSDRAINLLLKELNKYDDLTKMKMINNSIMNSWKSVYPLNKKENEKPVYGVMKDLGNGAFQL